MRFEDAVRHMQQHHMSSLQDDERLLLQRLLGRAKANNRRPLHVTDARCLQHLLQGACKCALVHTAACGKLLPVAQQTLDLYNVMPWIGCSPNPKGPRIPIWVLLGLVVRNVLVRALRVIAFDVV